MRFVYPPYKNDFHHHLKSLLFNWKYVKAIEPRAKITNHPKCDKIKLPEIFIVKIKTARKELYIV